MMERLPARLRAKIAVEPGSGCWLWTGALTWGYGTTWWDGAVRRAHRVVYELLVGPIPEGLELDHVQARGCTSKACVNPDHLEPVTHAENMARADRGAIVEQRAKTTCPEGHPYDDLTPGARRCRTCRRETVRAATARYRERLAAAT